MPNLYKWSWLELIGDGMIVAFGIFVLNILVPEAIFGEVTCFEDNSLILTIEIVLSSLFIALGIKRGIKDFKEMIK